MARMNNNRPKQSRRKGNHKQLQIHSSTTKGFTTLELVIAMFVILIVTAIGVPQFMNMMHLARSRGVVSDFAGLVQAQRMRAVDDDRYYSTYVLAGGGNNPQRAYVDIYPQNVNGASGTGGAAYTCNVNGCDPMVVMSQEVNQQPAANAPATAALRLLVLPANSPVVPKDGSLPASPITFGPRGLPCTPVAVAGGTVCDSLGGPTAYWTFFQNNTTGYWGAVTVSPAGRIRRWFFSVAGANGANWVSY
ncbi:MAG TPA: hypothetical protein VFN26_12845 [Candidatus Acidoferrum sp.]|nr:hypothetical protein [Candidatus Acidoferrum sp.]